jgi:6-pyruvoyltetrahydropterin/6-carboxytetrahydropterin synthase
MNSTNTTLHLFKQSFKFSSAHFLIFDEKTAEKLHGHNYQVRVDILVPPEDKQMKERGFFIDFQVFKKFINSRLSEWDEHVLLPASHPEMKIATSGASLEVKFRDRHYMFPENEVILLPVTNTSVEQMSRILAADFYQEFEKHGVLQLRVKVEETRGQAASTTIGVHRSSK